MPSLTEMFSSFADKQRLERLEQCVLLEKALSECERVNEQTKKSNKDNPTANVRIQDTRAGMKISRFYGWGLTNAKAEQAIAQMRGDTSFGSLAMYENKMQVQDSMDENNTDSTIHSNETNESSTPCSMERHAIWTCRAMALQCAPDLVQLKACFKSTGNLNPSADGYTKESFSENNTNHTCSFEMKKVANCVNQHRVELDERLSQR